MIVFQPPILTLFWTVWNLQPQQQTTITHTSCQAWEFWLAFEQRSPYPSPMLLNKVIYLNIYYHFYSSQIFVSEWKSKHNQSYVYICLDLFEIIEGV